MLHPTFVFRSTGFIVTQSNFSFNIPQNGTQMFTHSRCPIKRENWNEKQYKNDDFQEMEMFFRHIFSPLASLSYKTFSVNFPKYIPLIKTLANMIILSLSNTITGKAMGSQQISIHHLGLSNPAISEFCHPSYMAITLNNFKYFYPSYMVGLLTPQFQYFTNPPRGNLLDC